MPSAVDSSRPLISPKVLRSPTPDQVPGSSWARQARSVDEIRRAIAAHIEARRQDADFQKRLQASIARNKEILERLAR